MWPSNPFSMAPSRFCASEIDTISKKNAKKKARIQMRLVMNTGLVAATRHDSSKH
jgi:hypothetical protein